MSCLESRACAARSPYCRLVGQLRTTTDEQAVPRLRLHGVDVVRGLAVVGMLFVDNRGNALITPQFVHAPWDGLRVADVVFPVFLLVVGVSMPFSSRAGRPRAVLWRVAKLVLLGIVIITAKYGIGSVGAGVLGHIAGAYLLCWLLLRLPERVQLPVATGVLAVISAVQLLLPVPGVGRAVADPDASWAHWFDQAVGLGFSAEGPHSYLPSAVTVFIGVLAGRVLKAHPGRDAVPRLLAPAVGLIALGLLLSPAIGINKRLWSPTFVLVTGGIGLLAIVAAHWLVDLRGVRRPFRPAEVMGMNAIVAFAGSELLFRAALGDDVQPWIVDGMSALTSPTVAAYLYPAATIVVVWAVCEVLARRGIVVRI